MFTVMHVDDRVQRKGVKFMRAFIYARRSSSSFAIILVLHLNIELMLCRLEAACTNVLRSLHLSFVFLSGTIQRSLCLRIALLETIGLSDLPQLVHAVWV